MFSRLVKTLVKPSIFLVGMYTTSNNLCCDHNMPMSQALDFIKTTKFNIKTLSSINMEYASFDNKLKIYDTFMRYSKSSTDKKMSDMLKKLKNHTKEERHEIYKMMYRTGGYDNLIEMLNCIIKDSPFRAWSRTVGSYRLTPEYRMLVTEILDFIKDNYMPKCFYTIYYTLFFVSTILLPVNHKQLFRTVIIYSNIIECFHEMINDPENDFITPEFVKKYNFLDWNI